MRVFEDSGCTPRLPDIMSWYEEQTKALIQYFNSIASDLRNDNNSQLSETLYFESNFETIDDIKMRAKDELDRLTCLGLIACCEGILFIDLNDRIENRKKDTLSKFFYNLYRSKQPERLELEIDILEGWKNHGDVRLFPISQFKGLLKYRHWLAHGRYWVPRMGRKSYDAFDTYLIIVQLLREFSLDSALTTSSSIPFLHSFSHPPMSS